jgi:hypothetical protein
MQPSFKSPSYLDELRREYAEHAAGHLQAAADAEHQCVERTIRGVEIFRTGVHNQDQYTERDLDDIVSAFNTLDFRPAIKLGHDNTPGVPAYGWVTNLRRNGDKLIADFRHVDEDVFKWIRQSKYTRLSPEIYFNLNRNGKRYRRALKAVALLGAEVPAVAGLRPLQRMFAGDDEVAIYSEPFAYIDPNVRDPGQRLHERVLAYRARHPEIKNYSDAMAVVLADDPELRAAYGSYSDIGNSRRPEEMDEQRWRNAHGLPDPRERHAAGLEIEKKMREEMERHPSMSQMTALKRVLEQNPLLAETYRASPGSFVPNYDAVMGSR